jgi:hypothetical protein
MLTVIPFSDGANKRIYSRVFLFAKAGSVVSKCVKLKAMKTKTLAMESPKIRLPLAGPNRSAEAVRRRVGLSRRLLTARVTGSRSLNLV